MRESRLFIILISLVMGLAGCSKETMIGEYVDRCAVRLDIDWGPCGIDPDGMTALFYPDSGKCAINIAMPVDGYWYLFGTDGKIQTGFQNVNGSTYYFDPSNGVMVAGTSRTIDGVVYTFQADGTCTTQVATANSYNFNSGSNSQNGSGTSNTPNSGESNPEADGGKTGVITAGSSR